MRTPTVTPSSPNHRHDMLSPPHCRLIPTTYDGSANLPHSSHTRYAPLPFESPRGTALTLSRPAVCYSHGSQPAVTPPHHITPPCPATHRRLGTLRHHSAQVPATPHTTPPPHHVTPGHESLRHATPHAIPVHTTRTGARAGIYLPPLHGVHMFFFLISLLMMLPQHHHYCPPCAPTQQGQLQVNGSSSGEDNISIIKCI
jgi:hypothetical protein